ncbi:unnamed protein product, partial [Mesorhabditis spiculigera]
MESGWYLEEQQPIYLDYNATTPLDSEVRKVIIEALDLWANPSSNNPMAAKAKEAIEKARKQVADLMHVTPKEVIFTSGGTECNSWVIHSAIESSGLAKPHIVATEIEHPAIQNPLKKLKERGVIDVTFCPVDKSKGYVLPETIGAAITAETCLVSVMLANNESGVIQPITEIADITRKMGDKFGRKILVHSDTTQAVGKMDINLDTLKIDYATVAGHKFYGPRCGALILRSALTVPINPMILGCTQESGLRAGTENTPMIAGLGKACEIAAEKLVEKEKKLLEHRQHFEDQLKAQLGDQVLINFDASPRLANSSSVAFPKYAETSADLLAKCKSFYASTAAAGHSKEKKASKILLASGVPEDVALRSVRFSIGRDTTKEELDRVVKELKAMLFLSKNAGSLMGALGKGPVAGF